jgi:hypothetical protein
MRVAGAPKCTGVALFCAPVVGFSLLVIVAFFVCDRVITFVGADGCGHGPSLRLILLASSALH